MIGELYAASMVAVLAVTSKGLGWAQDGVELLIARLESRQQGSDEEAQGEQKKRGSKPRR